MSQHLKVKNICHFAFHLVKRFESNQFEITMNKKQLAGLNSKKY